ncbi:MAG: MATE family efflux transporter [Ruminococcaceae bacterium]|nr:MATE family efflux transporter [Oscillospiraceae bacterium]
MLKRQQVDMVNGRLFFKILTYAVPIILTGILQLLFNAADLMIVGRFGSNGSDSVAAVGATSSLTSLMINFFMGFSSGSGVAVAQAIGAKDDEKASKAVHTVILLAFIAGVIVSVIGSVASGYMLKVMSTPKEIIHLSSLYMRIIFSGMIFNMLYNFGAAILRAVGDTTRPLLYLLIAGILNVVLNIFFVTVLNMDVAGVALATVISQAVSCILVLLALVRRNDACKLCIKKIRIYKAPLKKILSIGLPAGLQSTLFSVSNVMIQSSINSLSYLEGLVAGFAAAASIEGFAYVTMNSFYQASLNFTGQNIGAKKYDRVKKIFFYATFWAVSLGLIAGIGLYIFNKPLLSLYITDSAEALKWGAVRLAYIGIPYFLCGMMEVATGCLRGMGVSIAPMFITVLGVCGIRLSWIFTIFQIDKYHTPQILFLSYTVSWIITFLVEAIVFFNLLKRKIR